VASNHLTDVAGYEDAGDVAQALHELANAASGTRISAWDPRHDALIARLRETLPPRRRELFDVFATPSTSETREPARQRALAVDLAGACRRMEPLLDPTLELARVGIPTQIIHGRGDRLIPFTESLRLMNGLPESSRRLLTVTSLFNHSADHKPPGIVDRAWENAKMLRAIHGVVTTA
jgi:pimeloyl-ACP methyl ester carboxylesterase